MVEGVAQAQAPVLVVLVVAQAVVLARGPAQAVVLTAQHPGPDRPKLAALLRLVLVQMKSIQLRSSLSAAAARV